MPGLAPPPSTLQRGSHPRHSGCLLAAGQVSAPCLASGGWVQGWGREGMCAAGQESEAGGLLSKAGRAGTREAWAERGQVPGALMEPESRQPSGARERAEPRCPVPPCARPGPAAGAEQRAAGAHKPAEAPAGVCPSSLLPPTCSWPPPPTHSDSGFPLPLVPGPLVPHPLIPAA